MDPNAEWVVTVVGSIVDRLLPKDPKPKEFPWAVMMRMGCWELEEMQRRRQNTYKKQIMDFFPLALRVRLLIDVM